MDTAVEKEISFSIFVQVRILALETDHLASLANLTRRILLECSQLSPMGLPAEHQAELRTLDVRSIKFHLLCSMLFTFLLVS
jgi:hypothetical protein